jgi:hypothetical protein
MPYYSHVRPSSWRWFMNQCVQLGAPKTHALTNPFHSCQGVQVPVQARTLSPQHCRPGLNMVLRPPQPKIYNHLESRSRKSQNPWQERNKSSCSHKQVYAWDKVGLWPDYGIQCNERSLIDTGGTTHQSLALLPNKVQVHPKPSLARYPIIIHIYLYSMW